MLKRLISKTIRMLFFLCHPSLWGKHVQINGIPKIYCMKNLHIGMNVSFNANCVIQCYEKVDIGDNVTISDGAKILTRSLDTNKYCNNSKQEKRMHIDKPVKISNGVWLATNSIVLPGVTIAEDTIIAAGAVLTKSVIEKGFLYAGVPARKVKEL